MHRMQAWQALLVWTGARGGARGGYLVRGRSRSLFTSEGRLQGALSGYDYEVALSRLHLCNPSPSFALHAFTCATLALLLTTMRATRIFGQRFAPALLCLMNLFHPTFGWFKCEAVPPAPVVTGETAVASRTTLHTLYTQTTER